MKSITKFLTLFPIVLILICSVSCREKRLLKLSDGTFEKPYPSPCIYTDSSTQIFYETTKLWIDSKEEVLSWKGGTTGGTVDIKLAKSDRGRKDELRLSINADSAFNYMLPPGAIPNHELLRNSRIYIIPIKRAMTMSIVIDGQETNYYFVSY
ncbi:hypothetical protein [Fluviicola sp.]|uniref:hypothetical protein n=1 Tax=Fluviicola sp. TaxID=1917219 RepID=UPI0031E026B0